MTNSKNYIILGQEKEIRYLIKADQNKLCDKLGIKQVGSANLEYAIADTFLDLLGKHKIPGAWKKPEYDIEEVFYTGSTLYAYETYWGGELKYGPAKISPEDIEEILEERGIPYKKINPEQLLKSIKPEQLPLFSQRGRTR